MHFMQRVNQNTNTFSCVFFSLCFQNIHFVCVIVPERNAGDASSAIETVGPWSLNTGYKTKKKEKQ